MKTTYQLDNSSPGPTPYLAYLGGKSTGGTYILRVRVHKALTVVFGRFDGGRPIAVAAGDYAYVGSALADKGASCLARRLIRHATRLGDHPPHPIRELMLAEFNRAGLCGDDVVAPEKKLAKWNIDHLLDRPEAELVGVYLIRVPLRIEGDLARFLERDPATFVFAKGLGANDIKGNTHLMRVDAEEGWWRDLPGRLKAAMSRLKALAMLRSVHGDRVVDEALAGAWPLTDKMHVPLSNMSQERSALILKRVASGTSFSQAQKESIGTVFDTVKWSEVTGRLGRSRGNLVKAMATLQLDRQTFPTTAAEELMVRKLSREVRLAAKRLSKAVSHIPRGPASPAKGSTAVPSFKPTGHVFGTISGLIGGLRGSITWISKCDSQIPLLHSKSGAMRTEKQDRQIATQLGHIIAMADNLSSVPTRADPHRPTTPARKLEAVDART